MGTKSMGPTTVGAGPGRAARPATAPYSSRLPETAPLDTAFDHLNKEPHEPSCLENAPMKVPGAVQERARALGTPASVGRIRQRPAGFRVEECLGFEASGEGGHLLLEVEKTNVNTLDVVKMLAAHAGVAVRDVGYSGLKDKYAVCTQWFTVPGSPDFAAFQRPGVRVLACRRHNRKLKRGVHAANRFRIEVGVEHLDAADLENRLHTVRTDGVPNYFGEQRFGRRFPDNARRLLQGGRLSRMQRSMTLSGIRSYLFNRVVDCRVRGGTWNTAMPGEYVNLDGTRSGFAAVDGDLDIARRIAALDLHPTGPLYGGGRNPAGGEAAVLEEAVLRELGEWCDLLVRAGTKLERRATRCSVRELSWRLDGDGTALTLEFRLRRGQFATSVLREILVYRDVTREPEQDAGVAPADQN